MAMGYEVNWKKTIENITFRLCGKAHANGFAEAFCICEKAVQNKLSPTNKAKLNISELAILARFLRCDIMDLLVFEDDQYLRPYEELLTLTGPVEHGTAEEVNETVQFYEKLDEQYEIRDVYELLLYLPLINENTLRDVVYRCYGNLAESGREYVKKQLSYLYHTITTSPEKEYADAYRDGVLRVKGDTSRSEIDETFSQQYWVNLDRYRREGNIL